MKRAIAHEAPDGAMRIVPFDESLQLPGEPDQQFHARMAAPGSATMAAGSTWRVVNSCDSVGIYGSARKAALAAEVANLITPVVGGDAGRLWVQNGPPDDQVGVDGDEWYDQVTANLWTKENGTFY